MVATKGAPAMPWKETQIMDQRTEFALKSMKTSNFRELCREYGISPKTGFKWKQRFLERGLGGLQEESRKPHAHPSELPEEVVCEIVRLKTAHPRWGPRKIRDLYERKKPGQFLQRRIALGKQHLSDIDGVSAQAIIDAILAGERDPKKLAALRDKRCRSSVEDIIEALRGDYREEYLFVLG
jgi:transposase